MSRVLCGKSPFEDKKVFDVAVPAFAQTNPAKKVALFGASQWILMEKMTGSGWNLTSYFCPKVLRIVQTRLPLSPQFRKQSCSQSTFLKNLRGSIAQHINIIVNWTVFL